MKELTMIRPSDMHVHFRENEMMWHVAPFTAKDFAYAVVMPNTLNPPIRTGLNASYYRERIENATSNYPHFKPIMTIKAFDTPEHLTTSIIVKEARQQGVRAIKVYPKGATTHSHDAVEDITKLYPAFEKAEELGMIVCLHGEKPDDSIIALDWERNFYKDVEHIWTTFPSLKIVFEHISCASTVTFVTNAPETVGATITAHHGLVNFNDFAGNMLRPDLFCKPLLKSPGDQKALRNAMTSGNPKFFLGTDSAPHVEGNKYCDNGCAGVFTAPIALPLYVQIFDEEDKLDKLEGFASLFGPSFYGLPIPGDSITLVKEEWTPQESFEKGGLKINNYWGNQKLQWKVKE